MPDPENLNVDSVEKNCVTEPLEIYNRQTDDSNESYFQMVESCKAEKLDNLSNYTECAFNVASHVLDSGGEIISNAAENGTQKIECEYSRLRGLIQAVTPPENEEEKEKEKE